MTVSFAAACEDSGAAQRTRESRSGACPAFAGEQDHHIRLNLFWPQSARSSFPLRTDACKHARSYVADRFKYLLGVGALHERNRSEEFVGNVREEVGEIQDVVHER